MTRNIEWLKEEIGTEMIQLEPNRKERWSDVKYQTLRNVAQKIDQLDEPDKVVVPEFVAELIEKYKPMNSLRVAFIYIHELPKEDTFKIWIKNGMSETFARAWLYGYTVEKEKTYRVKLPDNESKSTTNILALRRTQDGRIVINQVSKTAFIENENSFLTEYEIKRNHEYLWGFAEEVSE